MSPGAPPVTILQLATMTAGLAREPREEGPFWTGPVASWEQTLIAALPHTSYETFPGTRFSYSNIGYAILGAAVGRVAGESYVNWERTQVLDPLGMTRTRFELDASIAWFDRPEALRSLRRPLRAPAKLHHDGNARRHPAVHASDRPTTSRDLS